MDATLLTGATLLDPECDAPARGDVLIGDGQIQAIFRDGQVPPSSVRRVDLTGFFLAPGFIDLHFHGDLIFLGPAELPAALDRAGAALLRQGVTSYLPTTVAWPRVELAARVGALAKLIATAVEGGGDTPRARPLGLHLEGPWIHPSAAGAQPPGGIRPYQPDDGAEVLAQAEGLVRMVTLAPEIAGAGLLIDELVSRGIVAALGHTKALPEDLDAAVKRGAAHATHLFNAMGPIHHRTPGVAGWALAEDRITCDLIADGVHVHPNMVKVAHRCKGHRLTLITDRIEVPDDGTSFGAGGVSAVQGAPRLKDGTLAGSSLTMAEAVRNFCSFTGTTLLAAVTACTLHPARILKQEHQIGTLRPGARADLVVLTPEGQVAGTYSKLFRNQDARHSGF